MACASTTCGTASPRSWRARGLSLPIIGQLLGHSQPRHDAALRAPADEALRKATSKVGRAVRGKANVVPMRRKTR